MNSAHEHFKTLTIEIGSRAIAGLWLEYVVSHRGGEDVSARDLTRVLSARQSRKTADSK